MKQLGILEGSNLFGDDINLSSKDPYKTTDGRITNTAQKAILWYVKENNLRLKSSGAWPTLYFRTEDDQEQPVAITEIMTDYDARNQRNHRA